MSLGSCWSDGFCCCGSFVVEGTSSFSSISILSFWVGSKFDPSEVLDGCEAELFGVVVDGSSRTVVFDGIFDGWESVGWDGVEGVAAAVVLAMGVVVAVAVGG